MAEKQNQDRKADKEGKTPLLLLLGAHLRPGSECDPTHIGAYRDAVLLNAGAALVVAGEAATLRDGVEEAAETIDKGLANALLKCWIAY